MRVSWTMIFEILGRSPCTAAMFASLVAVASSSKAIKGSLGLMPDATSCPAN